MADEGESTTWSFGDRRRSRPFSGEMGRRKHWKRPRFCFVGGRRPFYGGLEAWEGRRWEIGGGRESRRQEERDGLRLYYGVNVSMVHRCSWSLWAVGLAKFGGGSTVRMSRGFDLVWRGAPKARYTGWRGATGSNLGLFQRLRCVGICLVFFNLFF